MFNKHEESVNKVSALQHIVSEIKSSHDKIDKSLIHLTENSEGFLEEIGFVKDALHDLKNNNDDDYDEEEDHYNGILYSILLVFHYSYFLFSDDESDDQRSSFPVNTEPLKFSDLKKDVWECKDCYTHNSIDRDACESCEAPRDPSKASTNPKMGGDLTSGSSFKFGVPPGSTGFSFVPPAPSVPASQSVAPSSVFSFGNPVAPVTASQSFVPSTAFSSTPFSFLKPPVQAPTVSPNSFSFLDSLKSVTKSEPSAAPVASLPVVEPKPTAAFSFGMPLPASNQSTTSSIFSKPIGGFSFGSPANSSSLFAPTSSFLPLSKPVDGSPNSLFEPKNNDLKSNFVIPSPTSTASVGLFSSALKPTSFSSAITPSSPDNSAQVDKSEVVESNVSESILKLPTNVQLPENYQTVSGEENEVVYFEKLVKLFVFKDSEYKERGRGPVKILKHKETSTLRLLMRREIVLKVCLNVKLTNEISFNVQNNRFLSFQCVDFSENVANPGTFLLKFAKKEDLNEFQNTLHKLLNNESLPTSIPAVPKENQIDTNEDDDVQLLNCKQLSPQEKENVEKLQLPLNFYDYVNKPDCKGCIGCRVDELDWNQLTAPSDSRTATADDSESQNKEDVLLFSAISSDVAESKVDTITNGGNHEEAESKSKIL